MTQRKNRRASRTSRACGSYAGWTVMAIALMLLTMSACSRKYYRLWADRDAYQLINSRQVDPSWVLPDRPVEPNPVSRLADDYSPDCGPKPPDDPAANHWQDFPYQFRNTRYWDQIGEAPIENSLWEVNLPRNDDGLVELDQQAAVELALLQSRNYQTQVEQVYLGALALSSNQFEFDTQWFGRTASSYSGTGRNSFASRFLSQDSALGFSRNLAAGGQLAASIANSIVWRLTPSGPTTTSSNILVSFAQPLLRGAFKYVRLESLTQSERNLLYQVRDFAHFRREFYLDISSTWLGLLAQQQSLRNQRANQRSLELNLEEFQELFSRDRVSQIDVDQVFLEYQSGRISLLAAEQAYANSLDAFKLQLGLPPRIELEIDDSLLDQFELTDPRFAELQAKIDAIYFRLMQHLPPDAPPRELLDEAFETYVQLQTELRELSPMVEEELQQWKQKITGRDGEVSDEDQIDLDQQLILADRLEFQLQDVNGDLSDDRDSVERQLNELSSLSDADGWDVVTRLIGRRLSEQVSALSIMQNQIRPFLIDARPFDIDETSAVEMALANRLDLMNQRAQTMDAFRKVEVAADNLESDLNVTTSASVGTDPSIQNPVRFDSSESQLEVGVEFDGPLNRFNERNAFRSAQISYQQARRNYMALEDGVVTQIRFDLRRLRIARLNFQIARQQLVAATRQVIDTQFRLRTEATNPDSSQTLVLLQALQGLLGAKKQPDFQLDRLRSW